MYDQLFEAWKKEKENAEIQPLPRGFYADLASYLRKIREEKRMLDERTVKGRLLLGEEENVKRMVEELVQTRHQKLMLNASKGEIVKTTVLAEEEEAFYRDAASQSDSFKAFTKRLLQGRLQKETKAKDKPKPSILTVVRILQELPEIIGSDMKIYGPFKPEDVATLPKENARTLIKQGAATEVET